MADNAIFNEMLEISIDTSKFGAQMDELIRIYEAKLAKMSSQGGDSQGFIKTLGVTEVGAQLKDLGVTLQNFVSAFQDGFGSIGATIQQNLSKASASTKQSLAEIDAQIAQHADARGGDLDKMAAKDFAFQSEKEDKLAMRRMELEAKDAAYQSEQADKLALKKLEAERKLSQEREALAMKDAKYQSEAADKIALKKMQDEEKLAQKREALVMKDAKLQSELEDKLALQRERNAESVFIRTQNAMARFANMTAAQKEKIAVGGGWNQQGSLGYFNPETEKIIKSTEALRMAHGEIDKTTGILGRFWDKLTGKFPEFVAQILKYAIGFQVLFAAISAIQEAIMYPFHALKQGVEFMGQLQERAADIKESLLENVSYVEKGRKSAADWAENTEKAAKAAEVATMAIVNVAAKAALAPEKIEAGFKSLIQGGGLKLLNGDLEVGVELTAKMLSLMRARGVSETNQRRFVTEINQMMTGQVKESSVLLQVLGVNVQKWKEIRQEALVTGDLLHTHINATETVGDRLAAVDDRLANAQNRWKDLKATLEQYKNILFGTFAGPLFDTLISFLRQIKQYYEEHKGQLLDIARLLGQSVANLTQMILLFGAANNPLMTMVMWLGKAAVHLEGMLDSFLTMHKLVSGPDRGALDDSERTVRDLSFKRDQARPGSDQRKEFERQITEELKKQVKLQEDYDKASKNLFNEERAAFTLREEDREKTLQGYAYAEQANLATGSSLRDINAKVAENQLKVKSKEHELDLAKAKDAHSAATKTLTKELKTLQDIQKGLLEQQKSISLVSSGVAPSILEYLDKPHGVDKDEQRAATKKLAKDRREFEEELAAEKQKGQREIDAINEQLAAGEISENEAREKRIAILKREREAIFALVEVYKALVRQSGAKPDEIDAAQAHINKTGSTAAQGATHTISREDQEASRKARQVEIADLDREMQANRRMYAEKIRLAKETGATEEEIARMNKQLHNEEHFDLILLMTKKAQEYHKDSDERKAIMKDIANANKLNEQRIATDDRAITVAAQKDALKELEHRTKVREAEVTAMENANNAAIRNGITMMQRLKNQAALSQKILETTTATLIDTQAELNHALAAGADKEAIQKLIDKTNELKNARDKAQQDASKDKDKASWGAWFNSSIWGKDENGEDKESLKEAFDGFGTSVESLNNAFQFFKSVVGNLINAWKQGKESGGVLGGIGGVMSSVGGMLPGPWGAALSLGGGILSMIGGIFTAAARRIAAEIKRDFDATMKAYQSGDASLIDTIHKVERERQDAIRRLSGKKGGGDELKKLLPQIDDQLKALKKQAAEIIAAFNTMVKVMSLHSDVLASFAKSWQDINKQVKEYIEAGGDAATASKFLSLSLEKQRADLITQLHQGERDALSDAIALNDLLQQRVQLVEDWKKSEFDILNANALERRQSTAVSAGIEYQKKKKEFETSLSNVDSQISLTTARVTAEKTIFTLATDITELHKRDNELQLMELDAQLQKYRDMYQLVQSIVQSANGGWVLSNSMQGLFGQAAVGSITNVGGINVNVNLGGYSGETEPGKVLRFGKQVGDSVWDAINDQYRYGVYAPFQLG